MQIKKLWRLSFQEKKDGGLCGYLTTVAVLRLEQGVAQGCIVQQCINLQKFTTSVITFFGTTHLYVAFAMKCALDAVCNGIIFMSIGPLNYWFSQYPPLLSL